MLPNYDKENHGPEPETNSSERPAVNVGVCGLLC